MELLSPDKPILELEELVIKPHMNLNPTLGILLSQNATNNEKYYAKCIQEMAPKYNAEVITKTCKDITEAGFQITQFKRNPKVQGIINLSNFGLGNQNLNDMIPTRLDLNAYSSVTKGKLVTSNSSIGFRVGPCGAAAGLKMLQYEDINFENSRIAVIGRSIQVGRPLAEMLCQQGASITVFNENLKNIDLSRFDIVCNTVNQHDFITADFWKEGFDNLKYIIDIGTNSDKEGHSIGSIKHDDFKEVNVKIASIVGCIDKLTLVILFSKLMVNAAVMNGEIL